jgi:hypothetical protein
VSDTDAHATGPETAPDTVPPPAGADSPARAPRRRPLRNGLIGLLVVLILALAFGFTLLGLTGSYLRLPVWAVAEAEARVNRALAPAFPENAIAIGGVEIGVEEDWVPRLRLEDTRLLHRDGSPVLILPEMRLSFSLDALQQGEIRPSSLRLSGTRVDLTREKDGSFDIAFGGAGDRRIDSLTAVFALIDDAFDTPVLSRLEAVEADALTLTLTDRLSGRVWDLGDGRLRLENGVDELRGQMALSLIGADGRPAQAQLTAITRKGEAAARLSAKVDRIRAADLAALIPPLAPLGAVDAPISGELSARLSAEGVTGMDATLAFGSGALRPTDAAAPIAFDRAAMQVSYDPARGRVNMTAFDVESTTLRLRATGHSYLTDAVGNILTGPLGARPAHSFLTQVHISEMQVDPEGLFQKPVRFTEGAIDLRLRLDPFSIDIGQVALVEDGRRLAAKGKVSAGADGWTAAVDLTLDSIGHADLLAIWPVKLVQRTRDWLAQNVLEGTLTDVKAALRIAPGKEPVLSMGYDFSGADVRFIRTLPPIRDADGYATIEGMTYTMVVSRGAVTPPLGGVIDMSGSVFSVLDITRRPAQAEVVLRTSSSLTAALSLLDEPPFGFLTKAGRPVDLGEGRAQLEATLRFPLVPRITAQDVGFAVQGRVTDFRSDRLVAGKIVAAPDLSLSADPRGLRVAGPGTIGRVPFDVTFLQPFGTDAPPASIEGTVALSRDTITEFGLGLPEAIARGDGQGMVTITLPKGAPPQLRLVSDLNRIELAIPGTGWRKPAARVGRLEVAATLSKPAAIDGLTISAPGLAARGQVSLRPDGGLDVADFTEVNLDEWLSGRVRISGRGAGRPVAVLVSDATVDLRRRPDAGGDGAAEGGAVDIPLTFALNRLRVTDSISLTDFRGDFSLRGGFNGNFSALVNGQAAVTGTVVPTDNGAAIRVLSDNAGGVLSSAGVFASARGGQLDLRLLPRGAAGVYDGSADLRNFRVVDAPVLAELLNAVSVVGILEQLNGEGLAFGQGLAEFVLTPDAVQITRGSAVGNSIGVSLAGVYGTRDGRLDLQGVVSPIYMLNGIGAILTRRGEGLFGFNYTLRGTKDRVAVSVNPLSILTPGMFRELFRGEPPRLEGPDG